MLTPLTQPLLPELGPAGSVEIGAAPAPGDDERGWPALLLPLVSGVGMLGFAVLSRSMVALALGGGFAVLSAVVAVCAGRHQRRRREKAWAARSKHFRAELASSVTALVEGADRQRAHALAIHPPPASAALDVRAGTVWSSPAGPGLAVRLGIGRAPAQLAPHRQATAGPEADAELAQLADDAASRHGSVDAIPLTLDLAATPSVVVLGDLLPLIRALVVSLARAAGPARLAIHALAPAAELDWIRRLPHAGVLEAGPGRFCAELRTAVSSGEPDRVRHVVVLAGREDAVRAAWSELVRLPDPDAGSAVSLVALLPAATDPPTPADVVISFDSEGCLLVQGSSENPSRASVAQHDAVTHAAAREFATAMQACLPAREHSEPSSVSPSLEALLKAGPRDRLQLPLGVDDTGSPVTLDLREAAHGGDGPHGLVVGATGTGKSELLRTLLTAAASQNGPRQLTFLLVDFKGGAALSGLAALPHTAGLLTNLSTDLHGVDRLCAALRAELRRRQQLLHKVGAGDLDAFNAACPLGSDPTLPRLLVVVDEYAELIEQSPDVLDVLTSVARLGRSLGVHLLLCSQRLDDGRLRGLEAHLRYRVCLRTFTSSESLAVLGSADAATLPSAPGWGYLNRDGVLTRLRVALAGLPPALETQPQPARARAICPPPLPSALSLDQTTDGACAGAGVAIGRCDRPDLGQQPALRYDPDSGGHVAVVGTPRSGRSTLLTTLVAALASAMPTRELAVHAVSPAGSPLVAAGGLPHVGTVATAPELAGRVIRTVAETVAQRRAGIGSAGRVLLVIDDLGAVLAADEDLATPIALIATAGQSAGVTLAVSCGRWAELRGGMREAMTTRFELACHDPADSMLPQLARTFPNRPSGRVLTGDGHWAQLALPRLDGVASTDGLAAGVTDLVAAIAHRGGPATPPIQLLPSVVPAASLPPARSADGLVLGVTGPYARPAEIGLPSGEHLLVLGNSASGRSGLLRSIAAGKQRQGARVWVVDPRRSFATFPGAFARACTADDMAALIRELVASGERAEASSRDLLIIDDLEAATGRGGGAAFLPLLDLLPVAAECGLSVVAARRMAGYGRAAYEPFFAAFLEVCENAVVLSGDPSEGMVIGGVRPRRLPPGRGQLVVRGEPAGELQATWLAADCDQDGTKRIHTSPVVPRYDSWAQAL
jgi:S-DNA-T family DNA segregation ATPase FtsK/SpoIIIE